MTDQEQINQSSNNQEGISFSSKEEALKYLDTVYLVDKMVLVGDSPSQEDNVLCEVIKKFNLETSISPDKYPRIFAWYVFIIKFKEIIRAGWDEAVAKDNNLEAVKKALRAETDEDADARREKQKWEGYVPTADKRPLDEFYDVDSVEAAAVEGPIDVSVDKDGQILKHIMRKTSSKYDRCIETNDIVHYMHETRYSNGQLVDFEEKRKAKEKFEMSSLQQHEHLRHAFLTMKKGEIAWFNIGPKYHGNIYHNYCKKDHLAKDVVISDRIWIKLSVESIKRQPIYNDKESWAGKCNYLEKVREICKELIDEEEYTNAQQLYQRVLGEFKNMPKKIRDQLSDEQKDQRIKHMVVLNLNLSLVHYRRGQASDAIKKAKDAIDLNPQECKAHYRLGMAYKLNNDLDQAKEALMEAVKLEPNNELIRKEYSQMKALKTEKEKQWYSKMNGFLSSDKMKKIEQTDKDQEKLKYKIRRKCLERRRDEEEDEEEDEDASQPAVSYNVIQHKPAGAPAAVEERASGLDRDGDSQMAQE